FFPAEDGIRDDLVTGVQTCALPISLFPSGEDVIARDTYPSIQKIAIAMNRIPNPVRLEGHTDAVPIHNSRFRSNWELSAARSIEIGRASCRERGGERGGQGIELRKG